MVYGYDGESYQQITVLAPGQNAWAVVACGWAPHPQPEHAVNDARHIPIEFVAGNVVLWRRLIGRWPQQVPLDRAASAPPTVPSGWSAQRR